MLVSVTIRKKHYLLFFIYSKVEGGAGAQRHRLEQENIPFEAPW